MTERDDGGPAFPGAGAAPGMSLRDYFAAHAMQRLLSIGGEAWVKTPTADDLRKLMAQKAYDMADGMLEARER